MKFIESFFLGIFGAIGALILEVAALTLSTPLSSNAGAISSQLMSFDYVFFLAILIEEVLKYIFILKIISRFPNPKNIILCSMFFGLGFSMLEAALIYWNYRSGFYFGFSGFWGIAAIHISTSMMIGYAASKKAWFSLVFGLFPAILAHSAYNVLKISETSYQNRLETILFAFLITLDIFFLIASRRTHKTKEI